jgi:AraC-like DNA-binding protein
LNIPDVRFAPAGNREVMIEVLDLEDLYQRRDKMDHCPEKPHRMGFSMIVFVQEGRGDHFIDFKRWPFQSGSALFVNKNQINAFDLSNRPQGRAVLFQQALIDRLQTTMRLPLFTPDYLYRDYVPVVDTGPELRRRCTRLLQEIETESRHHEPDSAVTMHVFSALMILLQRERKALQTQRLSELERKKFTAFVELLETSFTVTRNAADFADELHTTYKTLNALCKKAADKTAKQLIDAYTILEAKRRLVAERKRVQDLADELGFDEVTNFTKYFKKHTGITPAHFQKREQ